MSHAFTCAYDTHSYKKMKRSKRFKNREVKVAHLKTLAQLEYYPSGAEEKEYEGKRGKVTVYKRTWRGGSSKIIKKQCNRTFRRTYKIEHRLPRGACKKMTEFWYVLT